MHRARTFTKVFQATEDQPWIVRKSKALREYLETVPLYVRQHDGIAGSITELPGAMPVMVEIGIAENYVAVGCNKLAIPGKWHYNPGAHAAYLPAIEAVLTSGKGLKGQALEAVGRDATVEDVMTTVLRDRDYYKASGGGVTLSGGEPLFQPRFSEAVLRAAKARQIHCCVETSGYALWGSVRNIVPLVDLWLFDFKETNPRLHERFMGKSNKLILDTLRRLHDAAAARSLSAPRPPVFQGATAWSRSLPIT